MKLGLTGIYYDVVYYIMERVEFNNVFYPSDLNGCGAWRGTFPTHTIWSMGSDTHININIMPTVTTEGRFYKNMNSVMVQRLVDEGQFKFFTEFLVPTAESCQCWTIYNIDDAMHYKDIVKFNRGRRAFLGEKTQERIRTMLNKADFVLVTTDYIKNYYHERYGVPLENIIAIPNYLPRWWIGDFYNLDERVDMFRRNKPRPRVGIVSSLSHYNLDGIRQDRTGCVVWPERVKDKDGNETLRWRNERGEEVPESECEIVEDDLDLVLKTIEETIDEFQWVVFGYTPPKLEKYVKAGKVECHSGVPILNYPAALYRLNLQAVVAPVSDCVFNRCKSNIKWLECCAEGIPLYASNIPTYSAYMPATQLFSSPDELKEKLLKLKKGSVGIFKSIIEKQWKFVNSKHNECGIKSPNWWMEDNIGQWMRLFSMRWKGSRLSMTKVLGVLQMEDPGDLGHPLYEDKERGLLVVA